MAGDCLVFFAAVFLGCHVALAHPICVTSQKTAAKETSDCCVFKFLQLSVDGKHLMLFSTSVFQFFQHSVYEAKVD